MTLLDQNLTGAGKAKLNGHRRRADGQLVLLAENLGDAALNAESAPVTLADALPPGLRATSPAPDPAQPGPQRKALPCSLATLSCAFAGHLAPYQILEVRIDVLANPAPIREPRSRERRRHRRAARLTRPIALAGETPFGLEEFASRFEEAAGPPTNAPAPTPSR